MNKLVLFLQESNVSFLLPLLLDIQRKEVEWLLEKDKAALFAFHFRYNQMIVLPFQENIDSPVDPLPSAKSEAIVRQKFRQLAKLIHPDHAQDESERIRRTALLAKASAAMYDGDMEEVSRLLKQAQSQTGIPTYNLREHCADLCHKIYHLSIVRASTRRSAMWKLMQTELQYQEQGRDLLAEMSELLRKQKEKSHDQVPTTSP